ncbi:MAG: hypothetical protein M3Q18_10390 [Actinomycetota bacterium]|nr:hypothetical protein [Actinomycetota bacterium]
MNALDRMLEIGLEICEREGMFYEDYEDAAGTPTPAEVPTTISMPTTRGRGADAG